MSAVRAPMVAEQLRRAYAEGPIAPVRGSLDGATADLAYEIQDINTRHWSAAGRRIVGRKIGLTSKAVQQQLGVDQPDFGILFADMEVPNGGEVAVSRLLQPRAEAEVACVLGSDLSAADPTVSEVLRAIAYVLPAIEIVDSRIQDWKISLVDTIADNASSALYVLGTEPRATSDVDLRLCGMVMAKNDAIVATGAGAACLGHPLNAVRWLASTMVSKGRALRAGDVVLSGALGPMTSVAAGDVVRAEIAGLGTVSVKFI
jgi:2-keto-4-pentenoate hydratase